MLTGMRLRNFKSWADTGELRFRPITGLFGANSTGKSSLLQALLLLKQTAASADRRQVFEFGDATTPVDLGSLQSVLHHHGPYNTLELSLSWRTEEPFTIADPSTDGGEIVSDRELGFSTIAGPNVDWDLDPPLDLRQIMYRVGKARFGMKWTLQPPGKKQYDVLVEGTEFELRRNMRSLPRDTSSESSSSSRRQLSLQDSIPTTASSWR